MARVSHVVRSELRKAANLKAVQKLCGSSERGAVCADLAAQPNRQMRRLEKRKGRRGDPNRAELQP